MNEWIISSLQQAYPLLYCLAATQVLLYMRLHLSNLYCKSKIVIWQNPGTAALINIWSQISAKLQWNISSSTENKDSRVTRCLPSSRSLFSGFHCRIWLTREAVDKYAVAFWNTCVFESHNVLFLLYPIMLYNVRFGWILQMRTNVASLNSESWIGCLLKVFCGICSGPLFTEFLILDRITILSHYDLLSIAITYIKRQNISFPITSYLGKLYVWNIDNPSCFCLNHKAAWR